MAEAFCCAYQYDLFVDDKNRNCCTGAALMNQAAEHAKQQGAERLDLQTAFFKSNWSAFV